MTSGIYQILNKVNNKIYIGKALELELRIKSHKEKLSVKQHKNLNLQSDWNKFKRKNFEFSILEIIENEDNMKLKSDIEIAEKFHIFKNSHKEFYNIKIIAGIRKMEKMNNCESY